MNFYRLTGLRKPGEGEQAAIPDEDEDLEIRTFSGRRTAGDDPPRRNRGHEDGGVGLDAQELSRKGELRVGTRK